MKFVLFCASSLSFLVSSTASPLGGVGSPSKLGNSTIHSFSSSFSSLLSSSRLPERNISTLTFLSLWSPVINSSHPAKSTSWRNATISDHSKTTSPLVTIAPTTTRPPTTSTTTTKSSAPTVTVSGGGVIAVIPGTIVVGGPEGGAFSIIGSVGGVTSVSAGQEVTAENNLGDKPSKPTPTTDKSQQTSSDLSSTTLTTSSKSPISSTTSSTTSSSTPTASLSNYIIYPRSNILQQEIDSFTQSLETEAGQENVQTLTDVDGQLLVWYASLTPDQASAANKSVIVANVELDPVLEFQSDPENSSNGPISSKRDLVTETNALPEVRMFSTPPGGGTGGSEFDYIYDEQAGKGVTIYVMDEGFNLNHVEFTGTPGTKRWIFAQGASGENDPNGHGTCCASKAIGMTVGIARKADLVAVKLIKKGFQMLKAWQAVVLDVKKNGLQGKAVVSYSLASLAWTDRYLIVTLEVLVKNLIDLDVVVVCTSGNMGDNIPLNSYPALYADTLPIIVTGGVDNNGGPTWFAQTGPLVSTTAPSSDIMCADGTGIFNYVTDTGTSFAAPAVAGLAAYFLSLDYLKSTLQVPGSVAKNVKALIQKYHYPRETGGPNVAWNAYTLLSSGCGSGSGTKVRRQASNSESACPLSSAPASTSTTTSSLETPSTTPPSSTTLTATSLTPSYAPVASGPLPFSDMSCYGDIGLQCPVSSDGLHRCIFLNGMNLCVIDCGSESNCRTACNNQGYKNGFCTTGDNPCICNNANI